MTPEYSEQLLVNQNQNNLQSINFKLVSFLIILMILEGCGGKWLSISLEYAMILLRDCVGLALIFRAFLQRKFSTQELWFSILSLWTVTVVSWALLQTLINGTPPILTLIGIRFWLLYLWVAISISVLLSDHEFSAVLKLFCKVLLLMLPLVLVQNFSGPDSAINRSSGGDDAFIFRIDGDIVRATGTFSFTLGYTCFLSLASAIALSTKKSPNSNEQLGYSSVFVVAVVLSAIVSGSRGSILFSALLILLATVLQFLSPFTRSNVQSVWLALVFGLFVAGASVFLGDNLMAIENRFSGASEVEDFSERVVTLFIGSPRALGQMSFLGEGLGLTANVAGFALSGQSAFMLAEAEPERLVLGGGIIGLMYIALKFGIITAGICAAMKQYHRTGSTRSILLWITAGYGMISWPVTGQLAANAIGHIALALALLSLTQVRQTTTR